MPLIPSPAPVPLTVHLLHPANFCCYNANNSCRVHPASFSSYYFCRGDPLMFNWLGIETKMISFLRGSLILEIHLFRGKIYLRRLGRRIVLSEDDFYWPGKMIGDW
uniref:Uncharacterized protein n=1 Tax=Hordeum vulgare subsp. vulgare TaxID=112509 RepID=A0A8I6XJC2_HORVV